MTVDDLRNLLTALHVPVIAKDFTAILLADEPIRRVTIENGNIDIDVGEAEE